VGEISERGGSSSWSREAAEKSCFL